MTVNITGKVVLPDGSIPKNADIVFTPTFFRSKDGDAVVPHSVVSPISENGNISVDIEPATGAYAHLRYNVTVVEYEDSKKQVEYHRHSLGSIYALDDSDIGQLLTVPVFNATHKVLKFRQGDTIILPMIRVSSNNDRLSLDGVMVSAKMRRKNTGEEYSFTVRNLVPSDGVFELYLDTMPVESGDYEWNVAYTAGSVKTSSDYGSILIERELA